MAQRPSPPTGRHVRIVGLVPLVLLAFVLSACGDDDGTSPAPRHSSMTTQMGLQLTLSTSSNAFGLNEVVDIRAVLENTSAGPVVLDFDRGDPPRFFNFNVHVVDDMDNQVYTDGQETLEERTLGPGESHTLEFFWDQLHYQTNNLVDRGTYRVYVSSVLETGGTLEFADLFISLE